MAGAALQGGAEPAAPHARMAELDERTLVQPERAIERSIGVAEARYVAQIVAIEPRVGDRRRLHVHECDVRAQSVEWRANLRHVGERFAAERASEVTEKNQEEQPPIRELAEGRRKLHRWQLQVPVQSLAAPVGSLRTELYTGNWNY